MKTRNLQSEAIAKSSNGVFDLHNLGESLFRLMVESAEEGMCVIGPEGKIIYCNAKLLDLWGRSFDEVIGHKPSDFMNQQNAEVYRKAIERRKGGKRENYEVSFLQKDGSLLHTITYANPIYNEMGDYIGALGVIGDITNRKQAEEELRAREEQLVTAQETSSIGSFELLLHDRILLCSAVSSKILGLEAVPQAIHLEVLTKRIEHPDTETWNKTIQIAQQNPEPQHLEPHCKSPKGDLQVISFTIKGVHPTAVTIRLMGTLQDITEREAAQRDLAEQQSKIMALSKLSALGEMAGGIAHEISTPLAIILLSADQLTKNIENDIPNVNALKKSATTISSTVSRIAKIIHGLRSFSRNSEEDAMTLVPISEIIQDTLAFCKERFRRCEVEIKLEIKSDVMIKCRPAQISQVILNLLNNAFDSMATSKTKKWVELGAQEAGSGVQLTVTDCGPGIPAELKDKIFKPFFTTKPVGKGTGLGLSVSRKIIEAHGGTLVLDLNSPNTSFLIILPKT